MEQFLKIVASKMLEVHGKDIHNVLFVFPNRRSGVFFQHYLSNLIETPIFAPKISSIAEFIQSLSNYQIADNIHLLFLLYKNFIAANNSDESFDSFHHWGEMLLKDFDDIDKYLIDASQLFQNIYDLKQIEDNLDYLTEEQKEILRRFWKNFTSIDRRNNENSLSPTFTKVWANLIHVYNSFKDDLKRQSLGYEGMIFREVAMQLKNSEIDDRLPSKVVFVGLNALSNAEFQILSSLKKRGIADFYWDYDTPFVSDKENKASFFRDINLFNFPSKYKIETDYIHQDKPKLNLIGIPSSVGQSKYVYSILNQLMGDDKDSCQIDLENMNTAIILPDEKLLMPTLYSIPDTSKGGAPIFSDINVTMGYKISNSSVVDFMNNIFELTRNPREKYGETAFHHKVVNSVLNHKYAEQIAPKESKKILKEIAAHNIFYVSKNDPLIKEPLGNPFLKLIFSYSEDWQSFSNYLRNILEHLSENYLKSKLDIEEKEDDEERIDDPTTSVDLEAAFIQEYIKVLNKLDNIIMEMKIKVEKQTFIKLLKKLIASVSISFEGEPLKGLQIMGVLETRALDFSNVIILSMNEGSFPVGKKINSFIPYALRKGFGLPTYEHQDSIFAYHFYRLISRAKNIYLLYDTQTDGMNTGEVSRYYKQIKHIYPKLFDIKENMLRYEMKSQTPIEIEIGKTNHILSKLEEFRKGGERRFSASSLNTYLNCPLQFYFAQIEKVEEIEGVEEIMEASTFGTIFHYVMEKIYAPYKSTIVTPDILNKLIKNDKILDEKILEAFKKEFFKNQKDDKLTGQNYLIGQVIKKYVKETLKHDASIGDFEYIDSEEKFDRVYSVNDDLEVNLKGSIDRVDKLDEVTRIIDYKTGKGDLKYKNIEQLFDKEDDKRPKAVMQVFLYALLYSMKNQNAKISPNVYYLREIVKKGAQTSVENSETTERILNFSDVEEEFKNALDGLILEIFNPEIPFTQTNNNKVCEWCAFKDICQR